MTLFGGLELGADDYILKPFTPGILKARVRNLINARVNLKQMYTNLLMTPDVAEGEAESEEKAKNGRPVYLFGGENNRREYG